MGQPREHEPVCLIVGMLSAWPELFDEASRCLSARFGPALRISDTMPFNFTDYYRNQMGEGIRRKFVAFERPFPPDLLAKVKLWTNDLEARLADETYPVSRPINLDPGYLTPGKLVLATTKDHAHRVYLHSGIYAEVTLTYRDGAFRAMPWTYPDYRTAAYRRFFEAVRADWLARRRRRAKESAQE